LLFEFGFFSLEDGVCLKAFSELVRSLKLELELDLLEIIEGLKVGI